MPEIIAGDPIDFSAELQKKFIDLVLLGGEVTEQTLRTNVANAKRLIFLWDGDALVGVAALKFPQASYRAKFPDRTGVSVPADTYPFELGYVFVEEMERNKGYARDLVRASIESADFRGILSTARTDNGGMHHVLERSGFVKAGKPYAGRNKGEFIQLLLRPASFGVGELYGRSLKTTHLSDRR